ncbi:MAG: hypothetical protein VX294_04665 [Candidatus Latescibacterota bacterium]|nr:hypothetical protein [Candidatus Latescibacterota bacterium]
MKSFLMGALFGLILSNPAHGEDLSASETSYTGATILEGDWDVTFNGFEPISDSEETFPYAFFEGNTLYVGNSDIYDNTIDAIVEFFWFQSSIDRGTDFYVAVIKTRVTPGHDCYYAPWDWARGAQCKLWADEWSDWGEYPVLSVEAMTDVTREQGAFRWDWSIPFESYGIDAYGQVTFQNKYGIGSSSEGAAMAHGEYQLNEDGDMKAEGSVQVKGYHSSEYSVQTQYEVTLYEWDVFVDGRADLMAWDMYLNLGARETQSAYHEYFLAVQVAEGEQFTLDNLNFIANFDTGWYDVFRHELGISLQGMTIGQPYYEPTSGEDEEEEELDVNDGDTGEEEEEHENRFDSDTGEANPQYDNEEQESNPQKSGCSVVPTSSMNIFAFLIVMMAIRRRENDEIN